MSDFDWLAEEFRKAAIEQGWKEASRAALNEAISRDPAAPNLSARVDDLPSTKDRAELVIGVIGHLARQHLLAECPVGAMRRARHNLGLREGTLPKEASRGVHDVVQAFVANALADGSVDDLEEHHQVRLQELLELSYDEFLGIATPVISAHVDSSIEAISREGGSVNRGWESLERKLKALRTAYRLTAGQRKRLADVGILIT